ncbi:dmX-like protein 1 [Sinocyclocheilus grahami]|uniref:dmX-like protein 1 n=1 Tax=Sinocyclocheilus grahami TaxID=75366 RepID=UPI0007AC918A|nr:PREDICTED: dmX-like protein 1 [Sinocyclocheilus grahami]
MTEEEGRSDLLILFLDAAGKALQEEGVANGMDIRILPVFPSRAIVPTALLTFGGRAIAASYGNIICVFEPVEVSPQGKAQNQKLNYHWQKSGQFVLQSVAQILTWHPTGSWLLTGSACLQMWCDVQSSAETEEEAESAGPRRSWRCVWQCKSAAPTHFIKFSPDGEFFATAGQDDCLVKVWYSTSKWQAGVTKLFTPLDLRSGAEINFSFIYLAHPRSVTGFSWRKTSKYMPRGTVCNMLLTCCKDSVCRLWAETLLPSDCLLSGLRHNHCSSDAMKANNTKKSSSSTRVQNQNPLELKLKPSWREEVRCLSQLSYSGPLPQQQNKHYSHRTNILHANALCHFHIAASINPATDIPLLPSISSMNGSDEEEPGGPFTVHWLNNKELHLTLSMEVFLQQLRSSGEQNGPTERYDADEVGSGADAVALSSVSLPAAAVDHQVDVLLSDWNRAADMLFSIHPMDGSLLVWLVDWLDEYQPGMFRQAQVSFVSRIPVAFPTGDAISLSRSVVMYACNRNVDLAMQHGRHRPAGLPHSSSSALIGLSQSKPSSSSLRLSIFTPSVLMISKHADGSLNQWAVSFAEDSAFSTVLSVSHKSRYCGHRFHLNDLACHSLLPLLLTTSHHNALRTPDGDAALTRPAVAQSHRSRVSSGGVAQDPNAIYSELILWRVDPVGPLSFSGGVSELARINSLHASAFSNVAWLPTLIPSNCLGVYGNSPSACFIASDGHSLRLYQAIIEAKKLLSELSNPDISKYVGEVFNIISQQSTARPGCIIELDAITDFQGKETQLLHVFEEDLILGNEKTDDYLQDSVPSRTLFSARFYLVVVEITQSGRSLLHMWHLQLDAVPVVMEQTQTPDRETVSPSFNFETVGSPQTPRPKLKTSNLQSACRLTLSSTKVFSQELDLPQGVEVIRVSPAAGEDLCVPLRMRAFTAA